MSADAKVFQMDDDSWAGIHDDQPLDADPIRVGAYELTELLRQIETEMKVPSLRWMFRVYPDGRAGLVGYIA